MRQYWNNGQGRANNYPRDWGRRGGNKGGKAYTVCSDHPSCKGWVWNTKLPAGHNEHCHLCGNIYAENPKQPDGGSTEEEASVAIRGIYADLAAGDSDNTRLAELLAAKYPAAKGEPKKELSFLH